MPTPLSDLDFAQFTADYPQYNGVGSSFNMQPGQSAVVNWNNTGRIILVYDAFDTITVNDNVYPDVYYTDVTDASQITALENPNFTAPPQSQLDLLPQIIKDQIAQEASAAGAMINALGQSLSKYIGGLAGNLTAPLLGNLTPIVIGAIVVLALIYSPPRR